MAINMRQRIPMFEEFVAGQPGATPQNTPGMGNVRMGDVAGGANTFHNGTTGSADTFTGGVRKRKKKQKHLKDNDIEGS